VSIKTSDLKHFSKAELQRMHRLAVIDYCPDCKKYHVVDDKPSFPLYNISLCPKCAEVKKIVDNMLDTV